MFIKKILFKVIIALLLFNIAKTTVYCEIEKTNAGIHMSATVLYPDGKPAEEVKIKVWSEASETPIGTISTDSEGRFYFENSQQGWYGFEGRKGNFYFQEFFFLKKDKPLENQKITLEEGCVKVKGKVIEAKSGKPLRDILLVMDDGDTTYSNKKGEFLFEGIKENTHELMAVKDGYANTFVNFDSTGQKEVKVELKLKSGGTVKGKVIDKDGKPLAEATVKTRLSGFNPQLEFYKDETDENGEYEIKGQNSEESISYIEASYPGLLETGKRNITFPKGSDTVVVNFTLEEGSEIRGKVIDKEGNLVKDALVAYGNSTCDVYYKSTKTDENGEFHLKNLFSNKDLVVVQAKGFSPKILEVTPGKSENVPILNISLEPGHFIAGKITDEKGKPIQGAFISTMDACDLPSAGCSGKYRYLEPKEITDKNGYFKIEDLPQDKVYIDIDTTDYSYSGIRDKLIEVDKDDYEFTLLPIGHIAGKVWEADTGKPIKNFTVKLGFPQERKQDDVLGTYRCELGRAGATFSNEDGTFTVSELTTNSVLRVIVEAPDFIPAYIDRVTVKPISNKSFDTVFKLKHGVEIEGIVVDSLTQKPISMATVSILDPLGNYYEWFSWQNSYEGYSVKKAETNKEGKFTISGINPTKVSILATHPDYARTRLTEVDLSEEKNQKELKLSIDPAGTIEGIVYDKIGKPLSNIQMTLDLESIEYGYESYDYVSTDEKGYYKFNNLPSGIYHLRRLEENRYTRVKEIELKPGETKKVDFGLEKGIKLYGTVMHKGKPLNEVTVSIIDKDMRSVIASTLTNKNGNYEIVGVEPKEYEINIMKGNWTDPNRLYIENKVKLEKDTVELNFTFPHASLSGAVKDISDSKPAPEISVIAYKKTKWSETFGEDDIGTPEKGWFWKHTKKTTTLTDGTFKLENLTSGDYIILVGDYYSDNKITTDIITVGEDTETKDILIKINHSAKLNIKVISSETKKPIEESGVALYTEADYLIYSCISKIEYKQPNYGCCGSSNACPLPPYFMIDGEVTIENLKPGKYYVMAGCSYYLFSDKKEIEVSEKETSGITIELKPAGKVTFKLIEPSVSISGIPYMTLMLKRTDGQSALKSLSYGNQNGTTGFFEGELGNRIFSINTLEKGEYKADIEIYREDRKGVISYRFQKPLYTASETFTIEPQKETIVTIDMNAPYAD